MDGLFVVAGALGVLACNQGRDPNREILSADCEECLQGDAGCGAAESACSEHSGCEQAFLCALRADCFSKAETQRCVERHGCAEKLGDAGARFDAIEVCAREVCTEACGYATASP